MIHIPIGSSNIGTIVGIDPGSSCLGLAILEFNIITNEIIRTTAKTFEANKTIDKKDFFTEIHGERFARIKSLKESILSALYSSKPVYIACESPFYCSRMPNAYGVLMEVLVAIKESIFEYDCSKVIQLMDPPNVKKSIKAKGNAKKEEMKTCLLALTEINYDGDIEDLDEHSIDAVAVAYGCFKELYKNETI